MVRIAIVGDTHIKENSPRSRVDNYFETCLFKIDKLMEVNDYLIVLGDFFDKPSVSIETLNIIIYRLSKYKNRIYSLLGNHDAYYRTMNLDKTALGLLNNIGIVNLVLNTFKIGKESFDVCSIVPDLKLPEHKSDILLGHFFVDNSLAPKESLRVEDLKSYKHVFLGHDHCPYEDIADGDLIIHRNGSLTRIDIQSYNLNRNLIKYNVIEDGEVKVDYLEVESTDLIFNKELLESNKLNSKIKFNFNNLDKLLKNFENKSDKLEDVRTSKILKNMEIPDDCYTYLQLIHESEGVLF